MASRPPETARRTAHQHVRTVNGCSDKTMTDSVQPRTEKINATTKLAVDRTRLAHERTLMAWVRTAISLISFGFTIYKFFQIERAGKQDRGFSATGFSVLMIVFGLVSLLMATLQHRRE